MTTNTFILKNAPAENLPGLSRKDFSFAQMHRLWTAIAAKSSAFLSWAGNALREMQGTDAAIDIASVYYVRLGNEQVARGMGHAYIDAEAALMLMKQMRGV